MGAAVRVGPPRYPVRMPSPVHAPPPTLPAIHAITLDLDDTLWPIVPAIVQAERALDDFLRARAPATASRWPQGKRAALRERVAREHPHLSHDFTAQRHITLRRMFEAAGEDAARIDALVEDAFEAYFAARCDVTHYDDTLDALARLSARVPLAAISNGNACLQRTGVDGYFAFGLSAREHGAAKPDPGIFHAACTRLGVPPHAVLHVGDDITMDVLGAHAAGLRTCWLHRRDAGVRRWPHAHVRPELTVPTLTALADWLDAHQPVTAAA